MYIIVGAGISGCVIARELAERGEKIQVVESRDHIGGNCYDYVDSETGIRINKYGAHLFHTNDEGVWNYINKHGKWERWDHQVISRVDGKFVPVPVNITTVNRLCGVNISNEAEMNDWLASVQHDYEEPKNSEEMALSRVGQVLYDKMFKPYTVKQWNKDPSELAPSVMARIPVRNNFDERYFSDKYQALPAHGYTKWFENLLDHPNIQVYLDTSFESLEPITVSAATGIIYTGPIDEYFKKSHGSLEYRSIDFKIEKLFDKGYYQPNSVVNYPSTDVSFTRIVEYKHFLHQTSPHTIIVSETTNDTGPPYYPVPNERNMKLYDQYKAMAEKEELEKNVYFVGRLANYKYFNMDQAVRNALDFVSKIR